MSPPAMRLRSPSPGLLALPWLEPLGEWDATEIPMRDIPVGPSRHLVRFVETDGALWALKELPQRIAEKEYAVLRDLAGDWGEDLSAAHYAAAHREALHRA